MKVGQIEYFKALETVEAYHQQVVESKQLLTDNEIRLLNEIYCDLWCASYDSTDELTRFAKPLVGKIQELNKTLKFKS